jgi:hypothetical protein
MNSRYPANRRPYLNPRANSHHAQTSPYNEDLDAFYDKPDDSTEQMRHRQRVPLSSAPLSYSRVFASGEALRNKALFPDLYLPTTKS